MFFINAWNEWGEGCHIEPDQKHGYAYLEAIHDVLNQTENVFALEQIQFLETLLKIRVDEHAELEALKVAHNNIMRSKGHQWMEMILQKYRALKRF